MPKTLKEFVKENGGISSVVFEMTQSSSGLASRYVPEKVDMMIKHFDNPKDTYALDNNYMVILTPVNQVWIETIYGKLPKFFDEKCLQADLMDLINDGHIKVKFVDKV